MNPAAAGRAAGAGESMTSRPSVLRPMSTVSPAARRADVRAPSLAWGLARAFMQQRCGVVLESDQEYLLESRLHDVATASGFRGVTEFVAEATRIPLFLAHGSMDPVVPQGLGLMSREWLTRHGFQVDWHSYPMPHSVSMDEIRHLTQWLDQRLRAAA